MVSSEAIRQVQQKLNQLSCYVLGCVLAKCGKDDFGNAFRSQILLAMSPEFDANRLTDDASFDLLATLGNGRWAHDA